jgi:hypothetical protein
MVSSLGASNFHVVLGLHILKDIVAMHVLFERVSI